MQQVHLFVARDMDEPELVPFLDGTAAVFTTRAPGKPTPNEDAAALVARDPSSGIVVVADGAGGTRGGADASRIVVETLAKAVLQCSTDGPALRVAVLNGIEQANQSIAALGTGAATTVVIAQIKDGELRPYHAGDSIILVVGGRGKIKHQNVPHGPVGYAVEAGLLGERAAMIHEHRHLVSNFVGREDMRIEVGPKFRRAVRDTLLVASDGVADNLYVEEIVARMRRWPLDDAAAKLASICRHRMASEDTGQPSKPDDLTFVLFRRNPPRRAARREDVAASAPAAAPAAAATDAAAAPQSSQA